MKKRHVVVSALCLVAVITVQTFVFLWQVPLLQEQLFDRLSRRAADCQAHSLGNYSWIVWSVMSTTWVSLAAAVHVVLRHRAQIGREGRSRILHPYGLVIITIWLVCGAALVYPTASAQRRAVEELWKQGGGKNYQSERVAPPKVGDFRQASLGRLLVPVPRSMRLEDGVLVNDTMRISYRQPVIGWPEQKPSRGQQGYCAGLYFGIESDLDALKLILHLDEKAIHEAKSRIALQGIMEVLEWRAKNVGSDHHVWTLSRSKCGHAVVHRFRAMTTSPLTIIYDIYLFDAEGREVGGLLVRARSTGVSQDVLAIAGSARRRIAGEQLGTADDPPVSRQNPLPPKPEGY